ncbi:MAG: TPM domain-containing protein [Sulfuritalea sp.]|nr:TPM domain-containing protein [Sulfuritalea sp.]
MKPIRSLKHLLLPDWWLRRVFSAADQEAIGAAIAAGEQSHRGELRFVAEGSLPLSALWRDLSARERAVELFATLHVWDTAENSGILIYVQLAEHRVEILADRGIAALVPQAEWDAICREMEGSFRHGEWRSGALRAVSRAAALLASRLPAGDSNPNELPDRPLLL